MNICSWVQGVLWTGTLDCSSLTCFLALFFVNSSIAGPPVLAHFHLNLINDARPGAICYAI